MNNDLIYMLPIDVIRDDRLSMWQIKVLIALFSFRDGMTRTYYPSLGRLADRVGMRQHVVQHVIDSLVDLGWLVPVDGKKNWEEKAYELVVPELEVINDE